MLSTTTYLLQNFGDKNHRLHLPADWVRPALAFQRTYILHWHLTKQVNGVRKQRKPDNMTNCGICIVAILAVCIETKNIFICALAARTGRSGCEGLAWQPHLWQGIHSNHFTQGHLIKRSWSLARAERDILAWRSWTFFGQFRPLLWPGNHFVMWVPPFEP